MLQFSWRDERGVAKSCAVGEFPFEIGRSPSCGLQLQGAGVWEKHALVRCESNGFFIHAPGEAILLINAERVVDRKLIPGDTLKLGAVELLVSLSPARSIPLQGREHFFWAVLGLIFLIECGLAFGAL